MYSYPKNPHKMKDIVILEELEKLIPPLSELEYKKLEKSILNEGLREPIIVWRCNAGDVIIDGHNRYKICKKHGIRIRRSVMLFFDIIEVKRWMILNQLGRRNLSTYGRVKVALEMKDYFQRKAKENQGTRTDLGQNSARCSTSKMLSEIANVSTDTVKRVIKIEQNADEELKQKLTAGDVSINEAYNIIKKNERLKKRDELLNEVKKTNRFVDIFTTKNKYKVIYADPPYSYSQKMLSSEHGAAEMHYSTMSLEEICALPVKRISQKDSVLFLWVPIPLLFDYAEKVLKSWGFTYKTMFIWEKENGSNMGYYLKMNAEVLLIATRNGKAITPDNRKLHLAVQKAPKKAHSEKPELFRQLIDDMYGGAKIELFARRADAEGWDYWGNQVSGI